MKKLALGLLIISTTAFAHPENYVMDCGMHKGILLFIGHAVNPIMIIDKVDYIAIQDIGQANTDDYAFGRMVKETNEDGRYDKVLVGGAVTVATVGDGIKRQINLIDAKSNTPCNITSYNEAKVEGD
ncbi:hypothetical protein EW438_22215 [Salmonella enterica subsp. enterica serovar Nigeria]|nr:hypothetical protein [Salmonella enterica subsp. enterica serovar Nigeria]